MLLSEQASIDQIGVAENGIVTVRTVTRVMRGDIVIASSYHRETLFPGQQVSNQPVKVQAICAAAWTPEVVQAFKDQ